MNSQITPLNFTEWAYEASQEFLNGGVPMSKTITKIAAEHELNPVQIQRICEIANHRAYAQLYKTSEDKTFEFPLAKTDEIAALLNSETTKVASDYLMDARPAPRKINSKDVFGIASISNEPEVAETQKLVKQALSKLAAAREELKSRLIIIREDISNLEDQFQKEAKQMVINGLDYGDICSACLEIWKTKESANLLNKTAKALVDDGIFGAKAEYISKQGEAVDASLISDKLNRANFDMPVRVINGKHPVFATINTLAQKYKDAGVTEDSVQLVNERAKLIVTRMEDLNTTKTVDEFVQRES
jgi:hypothetical protein